MANLIGNEADKRSQQISTEFGASRRDARTSETDSANAPAELYSLLNEYAPPWYTERHQQIAESVLKDREPFLIFDPYPLRRDCSRPPEADSAWRSTCPNKAAR